MRWSETLIPTVKEVPQDAEIASHQLMIRAGLVRKLAAGLYTFMPMGLRALRNVERIVREEMNRAGAIELLMPALHPREIWDRTGRYDVLKEIIYKMRDRQDREMVLGPTHEEIITDIASREIASYRQLPKTFYQIQTKFRDEVRPRFGLIRAKEFIMKDAYSFDADAPGAEASYKAMYNAYVRIFERCGLAIKIVEADTGAMGGSSSHEFMVPAEAGEDGIIECAKCGYAANRERAERGKGAGRGGAGTSEPVREVATPDMKTVEQVARFLGVEPSRLIKTLIYVAAGRPLAALVAGDRDLNEAKLARALGVSSLAMADERTIEKVTGGPLGFSGPVGLRLPIYADIGLEGAADAVTGANRADAHLAHVELARDVSVTGWHDLAFARAGDACPRCGEALQEKRGIEVGHVFNLGTKYSSVFDASYLDAAGGKKLMIMGCYGIGITRTLQAIIEQHHDDRGIIWPMSVAPYPVGLLVLNVRHEESVKVGRELEIQLERAGIDVLLDDRDERAGFKFKDADLLGCPVRAVVSERSLADGKVEIKMRSESRVHMVPAADAANSIGAMVL
jgi:prolyl-tRNA synthetase